MRWAVEQTASDCGHVVQWVWSCGTVGVAERRRVVQCGWETESGTVWLRDREWYSVGERQRVVQCGCVCVRERQRQRVVQCGWETVVQCVWVCVWERETDREWYSVRETESGTVCVWEWYSVCVCVCVCVWHTERQRQRVVQCVCVRETESGQCVCVCEWQRVVDVCEWVTESSKCVCVCVCVCVSVRQRVVQWVCVRDRVLQWVCLCKTERESGIICLRVGCECMCVQKRERYMYMCVQSVNACVFECGCVCCLTSLTYHVTWWQFPGRFEIGDLVAAEVFNCHWRRARLGSVMSAEIFHCHLCHSLEPDLAL